MKPIPDFIYWFINIRLILYNSKPQNQMCDWTKYFYFLVCKNLNSSFSTWLTHLILKVSLHSWLLWPTVQCAMRYIFDTWRNTNTEKSTHASFCPFLLLTLHGFFCAMRFTTVGHEIHELDFLEGSVSAIRRGRKAGRPAAQTPWPFSWLRNFRHEVHEGCAL